MSKTEFMKNPAKEARASQAIFNHVDKNAGFHWALWCEYVGLRRLGIPARDSLFEVVEAFDHDTRHGFGIIQKKDQQP